MRYCVDFQSPSSDWISYSGNYEVMADTSFTCSRGWVVIQSSDFAALDPGPTVDNPLIPALSTMFAVVLAAAAVIWGAKKVYTLLITGGGKDE